MTSKPDNPAPRRAIRTSDAPAPVAHYSQAVRVGSLVFVAGQGPVDPQTGQIVEGDLRRQVTRTLENVRSILLAGGCDMEDVVSVRVFLTRVEDFPAFNEVYGQIFGEVPVPPARTTVYVGLPPGMMVEIDAVAVAPSTQGRSND